LHDVLAKWRQLVLAANAVKQGLAQFVFQRLDAAAERRLRQVQLQG
jgi:hypothetical protein